MLIVWRLRNKLETSGTTKFVGAKLGKMGLHDLEINEKQNGV